MAQIDLETKIQYLKGVGPKMGAKLNRLGIEKVEDLLVYWPRRYEDYTSITKIADLKIPNHKFQITNKFQNPNYQIDSSLSAQNDNQTIKQSNTITIRARIVGIGNKKTSRRRFTITEAVVEDGTGSLKVVWFNQPYLAKMLRAGGEIILNGRVSVDPYSGGLVMESPNWANKPKIVPIYGETAGLSSYFVAKLVLNVQFLLPNIQEMLPLKIIEKNNLLGIHQAIENIHLPKNTAMLKKAEERLAFDELFLISLRTHLSKISSESKIGPKIQIDQKLLKEFTSSLPFELTKDQKISAWNIIKDMKGDRGISDTKDSVRPMNRLLNGDVGSGKTVVAAFAAYVAIKAGYRVVMMAPTEILAKQHFKTCSDILSKFDISVGLITASSYQVSNIGNNNKQKLQKLDAKHLKREMKKLKMAEKADLIVGTHALLQDKIELNNIALIVVDEQHKFGVRQRAALLKLQDTINKIQNNSLEMVPHFLSMTATPIPRTLYLTLFSDLDLSVIKTMPKGRKEIKTRVVDETNRLKAYDFIRKQIKKGRQAFVVCPLIEEKITNYKTQIPIKSQIPNSNQISNFQISNEANLANKFSQANLFEQDKKSVVKEYKKLDKNIFPDLKIGMLHGKMNSKEKEVIMAKFKSGGIDILVSTLVVEVGVDIPNTTIIIIEDAERFGLAGLHQFRGRVGRAHHQSYCFLFSNSKNSTAINRLRAMERTADGFKLAEIDLKNRGAGDIFGTLQSGETNLKMASFSDRILIEKASISVKEIVTEGIDKYPKLLDKLKQVDVSRHLE